MPQSAQKLFQRYLPLLMLFSTLAVFAGCQKDGDFGPATPEALAASPRNGEVVLTWTEVTGAESYNIYTSQLPGEKRATALKLSATASPYLHPDLNNGETYYYTVSAVAKGKEGPATPEVSATPAIAPPVGATITAGDSEVSFAWDAVKNADSYNIYWGEATGVTALAGNRLTNVVSPYVHSGLTNGVTYYYILTSIDGTQESEVSVELSAQPTAIIPGIPANIGFSFDFKTTTISWNPVADATSYNLYWRNSPGVTKVSGSQIAGVTSPYVHSNLDPSKPYYYVVTAIVSGKESEVSSEVGGNPLPYSTLNQTLIASDFAIGDKFGNSTSISGDLLLIGAVQDDPLGAGSNCGSVYGFQRNIGTGLWEQKQNFTSGDIAANDAFGHDVAIDGNLAIIGAPIAAIGANVAQGAAYIFERNPTTGLWTQKQKLDNTADTANAGANNNFGTSVAISGNKAIVGAPGVTVGANTSQGAVYIFVRDGVGNWALDTGGIQTAGAAGDKLGHDVNIDGNWAIAGVPGDTTNEGAVRIYKFDGTTWALNTFLSSPSGLTAEQFGTSVALSGTLAVVGAPSAGTGDAYTMAFNGTTWISTGALAPAAPLAAGALYGSAVAIRGARAIVGAQDIDPDGNGLHSGTAWVFHSNGSVWNEGAQLLPRNTLAGTGGEIRFSLDLTDSTAVMGGGLADGTKTNIGMVFLW